MGTKPEEIENMVIVTGRHEEGQHGGRILTQTQAGVRYQHAIVVWEIMFTMSPVLRDELQPCQ